MRGYEFDHLLSDVNKVIGKPSDEDIRISLMHQVRYVFGRIGHDLVCAMDGEVPVEIKQGKWRIPDDIVKVIDVDFNPIAFSGTGFKVRPGQRIQDPLAFHQRPFELYFPNYHSGTIYALAYKFYEDEEGNLLIPEDAYKACYDWAIYEGINILNNPQHPRWQERSVMYAIANSSIYEARGLFNEHSLADYRTHKLLR